MSRLTSYHLPTKNSIYSKFKRAYNSVKNRHKIEKSSLSNLILLTNHTSDFSLTSYHPETKNINKFEVQKMGITLVKIVETSSLSNLANIYKIHLHTAPRFKPTIRSQVITRLSRKPIRDGRTDTRTTPITTCPFLLKIKD